MTLAPVVAPLLVVSIVTSVARTTGALMLSAAGPVTLPPSVIVLALNVVGPP